MGPSVTKASLAIRGLVLACALALLACGQSFTTAASTGDAGERAIDAGAIDANTPIVVFPPPKGGIDAGPCDPTGEPKDTPCLVDETYAVFVSAGATNGTGTRAAPVGSIDAGLSLAVREADGGGPKIVIVCAGKYDETITIDSTRDKERVFGGFQRTGSNWTYVGDAPSMPVLAPSAQGVPLTLTGLTGALFADIEIDAQSAPSTSPDAGSASGASSIGVVATGSTGIEFRRAKIAAGNGQPGADGVLVQYTFPSATALLGNAADGGAGGLAKTVTCPDGQITTGGKGGDAPNGNGNRGLPALATGAAGTSAQCVNQGQGGQAGSVGSPAPNGSGALTFGAFVANSWTPTGATSAQSGGPGQGGGGGGGGDMSAPGGGGGGGAGGCGGAGRGGGGGGGASAAIAAINAQVALTGVATACGRGGNGGGGVTGQPGQLQDGVGGFPSQLGGCQGGHGGTGGAGGAGGGGAGGACAGVLYKGASPILDTTTGSKFVPGSAGTKGKGGVPGVNDGIDGPTGVQVLVQ